jgi:hypothetical protein
MEDSLHLHLFRFKQNRERITLLSLRSISVSYRRRVIFQQSLFTANARFIRSTHP